MMSAKPHALAGSIEVLNLTNEKQQHAGANYYGPCQELQSTYGISIAPFLSPLPKQEE